MKKFCFSALIAACFTIGNLQAQQAPDLRAQAMANTRTLAQQIALDDARTQQVKRFTYERLVQETEIKQMYSIDPAMLQSKMAVVEKEYAEKLKSVLSDAQYKRYESYVAAANAPAVAPVTTAATPAVAAPVVASVPQETKPAPALKAPATKAQPAKTVTLPKAKPAPGLPAKKTTAPHANTVASRP
ncbi:hypothetical protein [Hymenobacter cellulosilyticus]|uniref:DUF4168 domain-containing protein n=1 Tax=Hymenobacter cellulosilyticus TaxID=2932248 RepID=A0A8T9Q950_9BACT|nr:hypothetical protein [Hymenobacter cellulosilyticus]UOQ72330.1 hypothetical protein MUN79_27940 [Hymenobacter cellulosilyticus]